MHKFTDEQIEFIREIAPGRYAADITKLFNEKFNLDLKVSQIESCKRNHKIRSGIDCRFEKGHIPANKGKKGSMSPEQYKRCQATMFKKGSIPPNRREIGSERITKDGYLKIKVRDGHKNKNWELKHRYIYEQAYGKIPAGHKVIFADGNNRNFELDNLVLITDAEGLIMNRNKLFKKDKDLTKAGVTVAKILDKVNKRKKDIENGKKH